MRFENKVVVITGAAGGIGKEAVRRFAAEGAKVVLVDLKEEALRQTAADLNLKEDGFLSVAADVSVEKDVQNYVDRTVAKFGRIDVFFNNAGIEGVIVPITDYPIEKFDAVIGVNLRGAFLGMKYVLRVMEKQRAGAIVNMSSIGGLRGMPTTSAYVSTKFAILGLTKTAAIECAPSNIRVNAVCPAPVNTRMMRSIESGANSADPDAARALYTSLIPLGRYGETPDVVKAVMFLASDDASFITGAYLAVDGGMTA